MSNRGSDYVGLTKTSIVEDNLFLKSRYYHFLVKDEVYFYFSSHVFHGCTQSVISFKKRKAVYGVKQESVHPQAHFYYFTLCVTV